MVTFDGPNTIARPVLMVRCKTASRRSAAALYCCRSRLAQEEFRGFRGRILRFAPGRFARSGVVRWALNPRRCPALRDAPDRLLNPFGQAFPIYQKTCDRSHR